MCIIGDRVEECVSILRRQQQDRYTSSHHTQSSSRPDTPLLEFSRTNSRAKKKQGLQHANLSRNRLSMEDKNDEEDL